MLNTIRYLLMPVLNASGPVFIWLAMAVLIPLTFSITQNDGIAESFFICFLITFATGFVLTALTQRWKRELTSRHGFLLVTLIWTSVPLFATIPLQLAMPDLSFAQRYFEMMSCLSTTGATVLSGLDTLPVSINGWRCFLSWIGGMGLIVLSVAILPLLGVGGAEILKAETSGPMKEQRLTPRIADTAKALYTIYLTLSLICAYCYHLAGMSWADAVMHMMTTVSLSGIAAHDASFAFFNSFSVDFVAVVFMLISGFNFSLHFVAWRKHNILTYFKNEEARRWIGTVFLLSAFAVTVLSFTHTYNSFSDTIRFAVFSVVSVASTTGYGNSDYGIWPLGLPLLMLLSAACATCAGSTGGGVKMIRLLIVIRLLKREIATLLYPRAVVPLIVNQQIVSNKIGVAVLVYLTVWIFSFICGATVLLISGLPPLEAVSSAWGMISNLGPGLGDVGPTGNYGGLNDFQLAVCSFMMLIGRLEIFTVLVLFTKTFWRV